MIETKMKDDQIELVKLTLELERAAIEFNSLNKYIDKLLESNEVDKLNDAIERLKENCGLITEIKEKLKVLKEFSVENESDHYKNNVFNNQKKIEDKEDNKVIEDDLVQEENEKNHSKDLIIPEKNNMFKKIILKVYNFFIEMFRKQ